MSELVLEARRTAVVVIDLQKGIVGVEGDPHPGDGDCEHGAVAEGRAQQGGAGCAGACGRRGGWGGPAAYDG